MSGPLSNSKEVIALYKEGLPENGSTRMSGTLKLSSQGLVNLNQLPKDKLVLDFVLSRLSNSSSPERFEIISNLLAMYRTSVGFDPVALSKGRMHRVKSGEFRKILAEIENELAIILNSDSYRQLIAKQANFEPLFQAYTGLSESLSVYPALSMVHDVEQFEEKLRNQEASELLLSFYRQHAGFFEEVYQGDELTEVLKKFDSLVERNNQLIRQTRAELLLASLEHFALKGRIEPSTQNELLEELGILLTAEPNRYTQYELLLKIFRAARISYTPSKNITNYLQFTAEHIDEIKSMNPKWGPLLFSSLALYNIAASIDKRHAWLVFADQESKENNKDEERVHYRLIKTAIVCENENWQQALKHLNEAEHLIHKVPGKSLFGKNSWITICEWRTILMALLQFNKSVSYDADQYRLNLNIVEDLSKHRQDNSLLSMQIKLINSFAVRDWETALELAMRITDYRKNHQDHPWLLLATGFINILKVKDKKDQGLAVVESLSALKEPFYSWSGPVLLREARQFFIENNKQEVSNH